ncbi:phosphoenolpyruvate--protein phosphotransferase [Microcella pacifica]|uniref:phosphoenolpyruvate--protein phosphotransferase n=1 Tax=Microcella pacifica TaxID=2591847 RepID=UPI0033159EC6
MSAGEAGAVSGGGEVVVETAVRNVGGLHTRPAAVIAELLAGFAATVTLAVPGKEPATATSAISIAILAAAPGTPVRITGTGAEARAAVDAVRELIDEGFGEELAEELAGELSETGGPSTGAPDAAPAAPPPSAPAEHHPARPLGVSPGRVIGPVAVRRGARPVAPSTAERLPAAARPEAVERLERATAHVAETLRASGEHLEGQRREVLLATAVLAADEAVAAAAAAGIRDDGLTPEAVVWRELTRTAERYREAGGRFAERTIDLIDVRDRIIARLRGVELAGLPEAGHPVIVVADDLAPADTVALDATTCLALVTEQGGPTSHTAIIARELGIPAIVGAVGATGLADGTLVLVDGSTGELVVQPDAAVQATATGVLTVPPFVGPGRTSDGHLVQLTANIGAPRDAARALERGAEGVGLFRTEFCFLDRTSAPTVDEQVEAYAEVLAAFAGRTVVLRTLDAGSDKPLPFLTPQDEPNPALGVRGYRTARRDPGVLDDQLRAIAIAAERTAEHPHVMSPMIATVGEAREFVRRARAAGLATVGIMIETPAAVMVAEELCALADFVSVGTNDLAQYTMAADRQSGELAELTDAWQPAVLRMISLVGAAAARTGTPLSVCGEGAADARLAPVLVGLGASSLSMAARAIPAVGDTLAQATLEQCRRAAEAACAADTPAAAREAAQRALA